MEGYNTESEQLAALRQWWKKNGNYVVAGIVAGVLVVGGWRLWGYWQARRSAAAANLYAGVVGAEQQSDNAAIVKAAKALIAAYPDSAYGALAGLAMAKADLGQQNLKGAQAALRDVMQHSPDKGLAIVARLRLARLQIQADDPKAALATLAAVPKGSEAFAAAIEETRGDAYTASGNTAAARNAYKTALAKAGPANGMSTLLQMKLASLPVATTSPAPAVTAVVPGGLSTAGTAAPAASAPAAASGGAGGGAE